MATLTIDTTTETSSSTPLQSLMHSSVGGAWMREASRALALAAQARVKLDEDALIYSDVRDLMALSSRLRAEAK